MGQVSFKLRWMLVGSISGGGRRILLEVIGFYKKSLKLKRIWLDLAGSSHELPNMVEILPDLNLIFLNLVGGPISLVRLGSLCFKEGNPSLSPLVLVLGSRDLWLTNWSFESGKLWIGIGQFRWFVGLWSGLDTPRSKCMDHTCMWE